MLLKNVRSIRQNGKEGILPLSGIMIGFGANLVMDCLGDDDTRKNLPEKIQSTQFCQYNQGCGITDYGGQSPSPSKVTISSVRG